MSLDKLAVLFIIIILPISVVLNVYTDAQIKTLNLQLSYDTKLNNATSDAIKAYQLNAFNESTSDLSASKMRDINAAANAFFNSLGTNFNMDSYNIETLQSYVPALVFTMYDGYYIYSKYSNTLTDVNNLSVDSKYQNGDLLYGTHPFVSYSCRYKGYPTRDSDFVISYTLDNYVTIYGIAGGTLFSSSGYLIDLDKYELNETGMKYMGKEIPIEPIKSEKVGKDYYKYQKVNGIKYYYDEYRSEPKWFSLINGDKVYTNVNYDIYYDYSAYNYYKSAYIFTSSLKYYFSGLTPQYAEISDDLQQSNKDKPIFGQDFAKGIEEPTSNFNEHRQAVIRYTIEKNLSIAIKNYNRFENNVEADFQMPKLDETEWDKIQSNMTLISFLQGMPIGGKIYNGCCVIANNKNDEVVAEESIYLANTNTNYFYKPTYAEFNGTENLIGILNVDTERRSIESGDASIEPDYYYPKEYYADYDSVVSPTKNVNLYAETTDGNLQYAYNGNIYTYMKNNAKSNVASAYFTALGRERFNTYKASQRSQISGGAKVFSNNNHKYWIYGPSQYGGTLKTGTWDEAEAFCESVGGHLVTINSEREQEFIYELMLNSVFRTLYGILGWNG